MNNRLAKTLVAAAAVASFAVPVAAQASQGADDPAGHVRQESRPAAAQPAAAVTDDRISGQTGQGADDPAGHVRRESRQTGTASTTARRTAAKKRLATKHRRHHGRRHSRRADDNVTRVRGRGVDDGPNHR